MSDELLIHVGFPKTATTWLQNELFVSGNDVFEPFSMTNSGPSTLANVMLKTSEGYLAPSFWKTDVLVKEEYLRIIKKLKNKSDKIKVLTSEHLSGNQHSSGFDAKINADRLKEMFPKAKILIVIKEQSSFLVSNYFQYLHRGGTLSYKKYFGQKYQQRPLLSPHSIDYLDFVSYYQELFGADKMLVLPYELFNREPQKFLSIIGKFVNRTIVVNSAAIEKKYNNRQDYWLLYKFRSLNYFRFSNALNNYSSWYNGPLKNFSRIILKISSYAVPKKWHQSFKEKVTTYATAWVDNRYKANNLKLSTLIKIDLSEYGYH